MATTFVLRQRLLSVVLLVLAFFLSGWLAALLVLATALIWQWPTAIAAAEAQPRAEVPQTAAEARALHQQAHRLMQQQLRHMHDELAQLQQLTRSAIDELTESFQGLSQQSNTQTALLNSLMKQDGQHESFADFIDDAGAASLKISRLVNNAVTSLQFEDMHRQLTDHIERRLEAVVELRGLIEDVSQLQPQRLEDYQQLLAQLQTSLDQLQPRIQAVQHKSVSQRSVSSGDVELF